MLALGARLADSYCAIIKQATTCLVRSTNFLPLCRVLFHLHTRSARPNTSLTRQVHHAARVGCGGSSSSSNLTLFTGDTIRLLASVLLLLSRKFKGPAWLSGTARAESSKVQESCSRTVSRGPLLQLRGNPAAHCETQKQSKLYSG